jgi:hypothetical protein
MSGSSSVTVAIRRSWVSRTVIVIVPCNSPCASIAILDQIDQGLFELIFIDIDFQILRRLHVDQVSLFQFGHTSQQRSDRKPTALWRRRPCQPAALGEKPLQGIRASVIPVAARRTATCARRKLFSKSRILHLASFA